MDLWSFSKRRFGPPQLGWVGGFLVLLGCQDCPEPAFAEGQHVRFTVLGRNFPEGQRCAPLEIGESFELMGGPMVEVPPAGSCEEREVRLVDAKKLPFGQLAGEFGCSSLRSETLMIDCVGISPSCPWNRFQLRIDRPLTAEQRVLEEAILKVVLSLDCNSGCEEELTVRVEVLPQ